MSDSPHFNYHYCLTWVFWSTATGVKDKYKQHNEENGDKNQQGNKPCALVYRSSWSLASCSEKERKKTSDSKHSELPVVSFFLAGGGGERGGERDDGRPRRNNVYLSISSMGTRNKGLRRKTCILRLKPLATSPRFNTSKDTQKRRLHKLISPRNRKWLRFQPSGGATKFFLFFSLFFFLRCLSLSWYMVKNSLS